MGVMMAPVGSSGRWPACTARVPSPNSRSDSKIRVMGRSSARRRGTYTPGLAGGKRLAVPPAPVILADIRMPEMDGVALLHEIRRRWPDSAVVMLTAVAEVETAVACLQAGAYDYIAKPFQQIGRASCRGRG